MNPTQFFSCHFRKRIRKRIANPLTPKKKKCNTKNNRYWENEGRYTLYKNRTKKFDDEGKINVVGFVLSQLKMILSRYVTLDSCCYINMNMTGGK